MISPELSTIQMKDAERNWLASLVSQYDGQVVEIDAPQFKPKPVRYEPVKAAPKRREGVTKQDEDLRHDIAKLAALDWTITQIRRELKVDDRRVTRIAKHYGITLRDGRNNMMRANVAEGKKRRDAMAPQVKELLDGNATKTDIMRIMSCGRHTIERIITENGWG
jgi:hypothetical protein